MFSQSKYDVLLSYPSRSSSFPSFSAVHFVVVKQQAQKLKFKRNIPKFLNKTEYKIHHFHRNPLITKNFDGASVNIIR